MSGWRRPTVALLGVASIAAIDLWSAAGLAQCTSDLACKGGRICVDGACASPPAGPPAPPPYGPAPSVPAPYAPAPASPGGYGAPPQAQPAPHDVNDAPTESEGIRGLMIAGPIVFGVAYLTGIATTVALEAEGDLIGMAAAPLVGPWIMLTEDRTADYAGALIAGGILQTAGAAMFIVGLSVRRDVVVGGERIRVELVPSMAHEGGGAYAVGSF